MEEKIKFFLQSRKMLRKRLTELEGAFKKERESEDSWPGHESNFLVQLEQDYTIVTKMLDEIETTLKKLRESEK